MSDKSERPKQTRKRGPNAKNSCATCKIRRKKCDETRPACIRCSSTGRTCDFLQITSTRKVGIPPDEVIHFDYFRTVCTEEFSEFFHATLWKQLILQATHSESFVLNSVLAIGALRRFQLESGDPPVEGVPPVSLLEYIIQRYNMASRELSKRLATNTANWKLVVLGSIVFLAIEVLQGNEMGALMHFKSGSSILNSISKSTYAERATSNPSKANGYSNIPSEIGDFDDLASAFTFLSVGEHAFVGLTSTTAVGGLDIPSQFDSIFEARTSLSSVVMLMYAFLRCPGLANLNILPLRHLPHTVSIKLAQIKAMLQLWLKGFNTFISGQKNSEGDIDLTAKVLTVQYLVAWIEISTYFYSSQMAYESYLSQFKQIVNVTSGIVETDNKSWKKSRGPCFTLDIAMARPLYFVARRCREPVLRRQAIDIMKKVGRDGIYSEGIYTGKTIAKVAEWIVRREEEKGFRNGGVCEEGRFLDVTFEFDRFKRTATILTTRRGMDGTLQHESEELDLSG